MTVSERLFGDTTDATVLSSKKANGGPINVVSNNDDYLFKNDKNNVTQERDDRPKPRFLFDKKEENDVFRELQLGKEKNSSLIRDFNERFNERCRRHYTPNGDVVVWCRVKNDWPTLSVVPLTVPLLLYEEVPTMACGQGEQLVEVVFRPLSVAVRRRLEPYINELRDTGEDKRWFINIDSYCRWSFIACFKSWNIPVELKFDERGWVDRESWKIIDHELSPCFFDVVSYEFIKLSEVSPEEEKVLKHQCDVLFAKDSKGVVNATEGIKSYCESSLFAKEFGLSYDELERVPYRTAEFLRFVTHDNNEKHAQELDKIKQESKKNTPKRRGR